MDSDQAVTLVRPPHSIFAGANWQNQSSVAAVNSSYVRNRKTSGRSVRWYVDEPGFEGGYFDVFVKWLTEPGDGSITNYTVRHKDDAGDLQYTLVTIEHPGLSVGDWAPLGNFKFQGTSYHSESVWLSGSDNGTGLHGTFLNADAVKLVPAIDPLDYVDLKFIHSDHLGTPHVVTDESGQVVWSAVYETFGEALTNEDPDANGSNYTLNIRFPGQYYDEESGLHYNYFRDYDPGIGRYIESDPIGLSGGLNTYWYVMNQPVTRKDELGLSPFGEEWDEPPPLMPPVQEPIVSFFCSEFGICPVSLLANDQVRCQKTCSDFREACLFAADFIVSVGATASAVAVCRVIFRGAPVNLGCRVLGTAIPGGLTWAIARANCLAAADNCYARCEAQQCKDG